MTHFLYTLEKYRGSQSRFACPACKRVKAFTRYIHTQTGHYLNPVVGRCNRESKCGYHLKPRDFLLDKGIPFITNASVLETSLYPVKSKSFSFIPWEIVNKSRKTYHKNHFVIYLNKLLGNQAQKIVSQYCIGTSRHWPGAVVFWQVDEANRIRTGKVMLYDPETGKRIKVPKVYIQFAHKILRVKNFQLRQCFFGEHLLATNPKKKVAIVESEKSAIIASAYFPQYVWLACGGLSQLSSEKCQVLKGREVLLIPDLGGYANWQKKAVSFQGFLKARVSDVLEKIAVNQERVVGLDIADFLIANRWKELQF